MKAVARFAPAALVVLATTVLLPASAPRAQEEDVLFNLMRCDRFTDPEERAACFEGLVSDYKERLGVGGETPGSPAPPAGAAAPVARSPAPPRRPAQAAIPTVRGWVPADTPSQVPPAVPVPQVAEESLTPAPGGTPAGRDVRDLGDEELRERVESYYAAVRGPQPPPRPPSVENLPLPYETTVTAFVKNNLGDFKLRIAEGWVFEDADGPLLRSRTLEGKRVVLEKNLFGMWRMKVDGEPEPVPISPVAGQGS